MTIVPTSYPINNIGLTIQIILRRYTINQFQKVHFALQEIRRIDIYIC